MTKKSTLFQHRTTKKRGISLLLSGLFLVLFCNALLFSAAPPADAKPKLKLRRLILDDETFLFSDGFSSLLRQDNKTIPYFDNLRKFIANISRVSRRIKPSFGILLLNGQHLLIKSADVYRGTLVVDQQLAGTIDGLIIEGYKYSASQYMYTYADSLVDKTYGDYRKKLFTILRKSHVPLFFVDYTKNPKLRLDSMRSAAKAGNVGTAFSGKNLTLKESILEVKMRYNLTVKPIRTASEAKSFFFFPKFSFDAGTKRTQINALRDTNFDLLVLPPFYKNSPFTKRDLKILKHKKMGSPRLVFAYLNVGEANPQLYYWKEEWTQDPPDFDLGSRSPAGQILVNTASETWQNIFYKQVKSSFIRTLIAQGFDGIVIDGTAAATYLKALERGTVYPAE